MKGFRMRTITMASLVCLGFGVILLLIHGLGTVGDSRFLFAAIIALIVGLAILIVAAVTGYSSKLKLEEEIARFHDGLDDFFKSNDSPK